MERALILLIGLPRPIKSEGCCFGLMVELAMEDKRAINGQLTHAFLPTHPNQSSTTKMGYNLVN